MEWISQRDFHILADRKALKNAVLSGDDAVTCLDHAVDSPIRPILVMMEQAEAAGIRLQSQPQRVLVNRVSPGLGFPVVRFRIFGVMNQQVRVPGKLEVSVVIVTALMSIGEFIVREKNEGFSLFRQTVSHALIGMAEEDTVNRDRIDGKTSVGELVEINLRPDIVHMNRKMRRGHDAGQHVLG